MTKNNTELLQIRATSTFRNVGNQLIKRSAEHPIKQEYSTETSKQDSGLLECYAVSIGK